MNKTIRLIIALLLILTLFFSNALAVTSDPYKLTQELSRTKTQHDNGFIKIETIDTNDPHYGWGLGYFCIQGYSDMIKEQDGTPVFLINSDDRIILSFKLLHNLDKLNDKSDLKVNDDSNGLDAEFEVKIDKFGKGCLIIQRTDSDGYTTTKAHPNYLTDVADTKTSAEVGPLTEGNYIIALDYELQSGSFLPGYNDYKIKTNFKIQNSNDYYTTIASTTGINTTNIQTIVIISIILIILIIVIVIFMIYRKHYKESEGASESLDISQSTMADRQLSSAENNKSLLSIMHNTKISASTKEWFFISLLVIFAILCITVLRPWLSQPTTYLAPISYLNEKTSNANTLLLGSSGISLLITALPGDTGTPIANQLANISGYLILVIALILAEKYFITSIGFLASTIIIPLACLFMIGFILWNNAYRKKLAEWSIRLFIFGVCIVLIIPLGCAFGRAVDNIDEEALSNALRTAEQAKEYVAQANITTDEKNETKIESALSDITKRAGILQWVTDEFTKFVSVTTRMLITTIFIPILMLMAFIWSIKILTKKDYTKEVVSFANKFAIKTGNQIVGLGNMVSKQTAESQNKKDDE